MPPGVSVIGAPTIELRQWLGSIRREWYAASEGRPFHAYKLIQTSNLMFQNFTSEDIAFQFIYQHQIKRVSKNRALRKK